jgi:glycosyltransferase involved in cell wall biosynthesis
VFDGVNGLLVEPGRPDALEAAIRRVWSEPALRRELAAGGSDTAAARDWDIVEERYRELYAVARRERHHKQVRTGREPT